MLFLQTRELRVRYFWGKIDFHPCTSSDILLNCIYYLWKQNTAAELIFKRADADKEYMGLTSWVNSPNGRILKSEV